MSSTVPEAWGPPREKTTTWYDPMATAAAGAGMDGRTFMEAIGDGTLTFEGVLVTATASLAVMTGPFN
jgi:hypothetical protein